MGKFIESMTCCLPCCSAYASPFQHTSAASKQCSASGEQQLRFAPAYLLQLVPLSSKLPLEVGDHVKGGGGVQSVLCVVHSAQVQRIVVAVQQLLHQSLVVNHSTGLGVVLHHNRDPLHCKGLHNLMVVHSYCFLYGLMQKGQVKLLSTDPVVSSQMLYRQDRGRAGSREAKQGRAGQGRAGQDRAGQGVEIPLRTGQARSHRPAAFQSSQSSP